ncbi:hypothetical protein MPER_08651, partial [Moniliophthora perniciosa FA553]
MGIKVSTNACDVSVPQRLIYHYDVVITPDKNYPPRFTHQLIKQLQFETRPDVFLRQGAGVYDGKKNLFMPHELDFGEGQTTAKFDVPFRDDPSSTRPPKIYSIKIAKVAKINPEVVQQFVEGRQSQDEGVLTALMAMNVIIRQDPVSKYPFNI